MCSPMFVSAVLFLFRSFIRVKAAAGYAFETPLWFPQMYEHNNWKIKRMGG